MRTASPTNRTPTRVFAKEVITEAMVDYPKEDIGEAEGTVEGQCRPVDPWVVPQEAIPQPAANVWFGGDSPVLPGRETVRDVTMHDLLQDINTSREGYCFLRVLHAADRPTFLAMLDEEDYVDIFQRRAIKLSIWLAILKSMGLSTDYIINRRAYYGENRGSTDVSPRLTNYVVPMWYFHRRKTVEPAVSWLAYLMRLFERLTVEEPVTRILLDNNHMETIDLSSPFRQSAWINLDYVLPNEYFGRLVGQSSVSKRFSRQRG